MTDQNYDSADRAAHGEVFRLSLTALAMILLGIAIWEWSDAQTVASNAPSLILADQTR